MPKWVYFLIGVGAAVIAFQRLGSIHYDLASGHITTLEFQMTLQTIPLDMPWAILYGLKSVADGLVAFAFGIISSMGFYLSVKR